LILSLILIFGFFVNTEPAALYVLPKQLMIILKVDGHTTCKFDLNLLCLVYIQVYALN